MLKFLKKNSPAQELQSIVGDVELPSFNVNVMNALRLLRDPDSSIKEMADHVQIDPGMNINVLKTVNSAAYGLVSKVSNIAHALSLMGRSRLEMIVLSLAVKGSLPEIQGSCLDQHMFWAAAAKRACLARELAKLLHPATAAESFTSALLQDMAVPVIMNIQKEKYCGVLDKWYEDRESNLTHLEQESFGYDHAAVGVLMAQEWQLPQHLIDAIGGHHDNNSDSAAEPALRLVSCLRYDNDDEIEFLKDKCTTQYNLNEENLDELIENALTSAKELGL